MKDWVKILILIIIIFICVGTFYYLTLENLFKATPSISRDSYLELKLFGEVPERDIFGIFDSEENLWTVSCPLRTGNSNGSGDDWVFK